MQSGPFLKETRRHNNTPPPTKIQCCPPTFNHSISCSKRDITETTGQNLLPTTTKMRWEKQVECRQAFHSLPAHKLYRNEGYELNVYMTNRNEMKSRMVLTVMNLSTFIRAGIIFNLTDILGSYLTMTSKVNHLSMLWRTEHNPSLSF